MGTPRRAREALLLAKRAFADAVGLELIACLTGWAGASVSLRDTLAGVRAIRDGSADDLPVVAFAYRGNLDDVRAHVAEPRRYGRGA